MYKSGLDDAEDFVAGPIDDDRLRMFVMAHYGEIGSIKLLCEEEASASFRSAKTSAVKGYTVIHAPEAPRPAVKKVAGASRAQIGSTFARENIAVQEQSFQTHASVNN